MLVVTENFNKDQFENNLNVHDIVADIEHAQRQIEDLPKS